MECVIQWMELASVRREECLTRNSAYVIKEVGRLRWHDLHLCIAGWRGVLYSRQMRGMQHAPNVGSNDGTVPHVPLDRVDIRKKSVYELFGVFLLVRRCTL